MTTLWHRTIQSYKIDIFSSTASDFDRTIRLTLLGGEPNTVHMRFGGTVPADFIVDTGAYAWTVHFPLDHYDHMLHLLQTEYPLYFTAYKYSGPILFAGLTTDEEHLGEGFRDSDLPAG